jgi:uncharacterized membrane protein
LTDLAGYCLRCGALVQGGFCTECRSAVKPASVSANRTSALCYSLLALSGWYFLSSRSYGRSRRVRFHALQSILLNLAGIATWISVMALLFLVHLAGIFLGISLWPPLGLAFAAVWLYVMISAYRGKTVVLPVIGPMAQQRV